MLLLVHYWSLWHLAVWVTFHCSFKSLCLLRNPLGFLVKRGSLDLIHHREEFYLPNKCLHELKKEQWIEGIWFFIDTYLLVILDQSCIFQRYVVILSDQEKRQPLWGGSGLSPISHGPCSSPELLYTGNGCGRSRDQRKSGDRGWVVSLPSLQGRSSGSGVLILNTECTVDQSGLRTSIKNIPTFGPR